MSSNNPEPQDQQWPTYPGPPSGPGPAPKPAPEPTNPGQPVPRPFADPSAPDDAYRAYQSYSAQRPPIEHQHLAPYRPQPRPQARSPLQRKYVWIVTGIVAAVVLTSMAQNGFSFWPIMLFAGLAWWIMSKRRK